VVNVIALLLTLSIAAAHRAVLTYERLYWRGTASVHVDGCRRESRQVVSCVAEATQPDATVRVRDYVIAEPGYLRVDPGTSDETVIELTGFAGVLGGDDLVRCPPVRRAGALAVPRQ
jgi:hypothetical protein